MNDNTFGRRDLLKRAAGTAGLGALGALAGTTQAAAQDAPAPLVGSVPRKTLGSTGKDIPIIVMGGSQAFDLSYDKVLHGAYKEGVDYIDCAQAYANGISHKGVGVFVEQVGREKLWLTSKVMLFGQKNATPENYVKNLEKFLPDLRTDYLDMFFMHSINDPALLDEPYIRMAQDLKKRGLIHHFGFSCHMGRVVELMNKAASLGPEAIDSIMFRYNFAQYGDLELNKAIDACKKAGIGLIAMKTQASVPAEQEEVVHFQSKDFTIHQAKLKAVWADERIDSAVSEMTNTQQLRENVAAAKAPNQLAMSDYVQLNRLAAQTAPYRCNGCNQHCESQIDGDTQVAEVLRYLMYAECYGKADRARELYRALRPDQREWQNVDFARAAAACPQGIDIAKRMRDAAAVLA